MSKFHKVQLGKPRIWKFNKFNQGKPSILGVADNRSDSLFPTLRATPHSVRRRLHVVARCARVSRQDLISFYDLARASESGIGVFSRRARPPRGRVAYRLRDGGGEA